MATRQRQQLHQKSCNRSGLRALHGFFAVFGGIPVKIGDDA
jgi:hypothetical protein